MKVLWICNNSPLENAKGGGGWFSSLARNLKNHDKDIDLVFVFPGKIIEKNINQYYTFEHTAFDKPYNYKEETEEFFLKIINIEKPDIIHVWGTEYYYSLAMVNAAERAGLLDRVVVHIQGICFSYAEHVTSGLPISVIYGHTLHDVLRGGVIDTKRGFEKRGVHEIKVIKKVKHILGRTDWDRNLCYLVNDNMQYHFCREMLRTPFYDGCWKYEDCNKYKVFISQAGYPIKGIHYFIKAFSFVVTKYPDAIVTIGGKNMIKNESLKDRLYSSFYGKYIASLVKKYKLTNNIRFLGPLSANEMKSEYLSANVYIQPSTIENSSNSLGEALLLGVPTIASYVGGTNCIVKDKETGYLYQHDDTYSLASLIIKLFESKEICNNFSANSRRFASEFYGIENVVEDVVKVYQSVLNSNE